MKFKGCHFTLTQSGIQETANEGTISCKDGADQQILTFCDVLSIDDKGKVLPTADSHALAMLIERWIKDSLKEKEINEETLTAAFEYANQRMLQSDATGLNQVAVSAVIIAASQKRNDFTSEQTETGDFLIAGVGDCYVYKVKADKAEPIFLDPLNSEMDINLSPEDRLYSLKNAIGIKETLRVHCRRISQGTFQRFACASYGFYEQSTEEEILELTLDPHNISTGAGKHLSDKESHGHTLMVHTISYGTAKEAKAAPAETTETSAPPRAAKKRRSAFALTALAASIVIAGGAMIFISKSDPNPRPQRLLNISPIATSASHHSDSRAQVDDALVNKLREKIHNQQQKIDGLKKELLSNRQKIEDLTKIYDENDNDELKSQLSSLQKGFAEQAAELKHNKILQQDLEYQLSVNDDKVATLNKTIDTLKSIIDAQDNSRDQDVNILQAQFNELQDIAASERNELNGVIDNLQERNRQLKTFIEENIPSGNDTITEADELRRQEKAVETMSAQLEEMQQLFNKEQRRSETLAERLREVLQENQEVEEIKSSKDERIANLSATVEKLSTELTTLTQQMSAAKEQASLGQERIAELEKTKNSMEENIATLSAQAQESSQQMAVIEELQRKVHSERQSRASKDKLVEQLKATLKEQETVLASLEDSRRNTLEELNHTKNALAQQQFTQAAIEAANAAQPDATRIHLVSSGETLSNIAFRYYGTSKKWQEIYKANRDVIADVDKVKVGTALIIP